MRLSAALGGGFYYTPGQFRTPTVRRAARPSAAPGGRLQEVRLTRLPTLSRIGPQPKRDVSRLHRLRNHSY
jgi:hypothetical protein